MLPRPWCSFGNQRGSAYLVVMFAVVVMSISMMAAAKQWKTVVQREKEADLLARGIEIQEAIRAYYTAKQQPVPRAPRTSILTGWLVPADLGRAYQGAATFVAKSL